MPPLVGIDTAETKTRTIPLEPKSASSIAGVIHIDSQTLGVVGKLWRKNPFRCLSFTSANSDFSIKKHLLTLE
jgi:hypothetical protein